MADDPLNFTRAEDYFNESRKWTGPTEVVSISKDTPDTVPVGNEKYWHGVTLNFNDNTLCSIQFIRPTVWRVRFDPSVKTLHGYGDENSRTIVEDYMTELVKDLDTYRGVVWSTKIVDNTSSSNPHWVFSSTVDEIHSKPGRQQYYEKGDGLKLIIYKKPFFIEAVRSLKQLQNVYSKAGRGHYESRKAEEKVIWRTGAQTYRWKLHNDIDILKDVVLNLVKPISGEYIGFGEQGGTSFMKGPTVMNYFNSDNMQYQQVYNQGPLDPREPLYHSDPFYIEMNGNPEHQNVTGCLIDNYSQIAIDLGKSDAGAIEWGTRFGDSDCIFFAADNPGRMVGLYTGIVGRPKLKPRWMLGNHQASYGYENDEDLLAVLQQYREDKIPLDGLHIDVDLQNNFRTFTIKPGFILTPGSSPKDMFAKLKKAGIKCSTNITPVISLRDLDGEEGYPTLRQGLAGNHFITDERYTPGTNGGPPSEYVYFGGGAVQRVDPHNRASPPRPDYGDDYDFAMNWNSGYPYHGAVSYGYNNGTPGYYPNLNNKETREWWGKQYQYLFDTGLEFVWQDMTTPAIHTAYGDQKGLPSRLKVLSDGVINKKEKKAAIEIWALFSYNLHKATYHGLNNLTGRQNKRNFILGRGSFSGMYRFAGLWSGDNASTWDFWKITVSQVLSVGLNGVSISGADTGGFEPYKPPGSTEEEKYCSPELLIRWYSGSVLLPWLRNHYVRKKDYDGNRRKWFQEPYAYPKHLVDHPELEPQRWLYEGVRDIVRWIVSLRYSLIQLLYDAMFENQIHGLPIAKSLLFTDPQDTSVFTKHRSFLDNQYMVGDILVAPIMEPADKGNQTRDVYLPLGYDWYPSNLRPWDNDGAPLLDVVRGGNPISYTGRIPENGDEPTRAKQYPFVTPIYLREGAIVPQIQVRQSILHPDDGSNTIKFNIYPGRDKKYTTYLDDGVSRDSAPTDLVQYRKEWLMAAKKKGVGKTKKIPGSATNFAEPPPGLHPDIDPEAKGKYRQVSVAQATSDPSSPSATRTITITRDAHDVDADGNQPDHDPKPELGETYTIILWYPPTAPNLTNSKVDITGIDASKYQVYRDNAGLKTVVVNINETPGSTQKITIAVTPQ